MQGMMSSNLPDATLLGRSGSAIRALPIAIKSAFCSSRILSPASGVINPTAITGTLIEPLTPWANLMKALGSKGIEATANEDPGSATPDT